MQNTKNPFLDQKGRVSFSSWNDSSKIIYPDPLHKQFKHNCILL